MRVRLPTTYPTTHLCICLCSSAVSCLESRRRLWREPRSVCVRGATLIMKNESLPPPLAPQQHRKFARIHIAVVKINNTNDTTTLRRAYAQLYYSADKICACDYDVGRLNKATNGCDWEREWVKFPRWNNRHSTPSAVPIKMRANSRHHYPIVQRCAIFFRIRETTAATGSGLKKNMHSRKKVW